MRLARAVPLLAALCVAQACAAPTAIRAQQSVDSVCTTVFTSSGKHLGQCNKVPTDTTVTIAPAPSPSPTPSPTITPSPVVIGGTPHLPSGYTLVTDRDLNVAGFNCCTAASNHWYDSHWSVVSDATRPGGAGGVAEMVFPAGWLDGSAPGQASHEGTNTPGPSMYTSFTFKVSSNWQGHPIENKLFFAWTGGTSCCGKPKLVGVLVGSGSNPLIYRIYLQDILSTTVADLNLTDNVSTCTASRGVWHTAEVRSTLNTPGVANGTLEWWLDGTLCGTRTNVRLIEAGELARWTIFAWTPVWGGQTSPQSVVQQTQTMRVSRLAFYGQ